MSIFIPGQSSAFREKFSHFLFVTDYMTVAESVDIVANKSLLPFITF